MEIKLTIENENEEVKFWIDSKSGCLCIETENQLFEVPNSTSKEVVHRLREKLAEYEEINKKYFWQW